MSDLVLVDPNPMSLCSGDIEIPGGVPMSHMSRTAAEQHASALRLHHRHHRPRQAFIYVHDVVYLCPQ